MPRTLRLVWLAALAAAAQESKPVPSLSVEPSRVFKAPDPGHADTESWFVYLLLKSPTALGACKPEHLETTVRSGDAVISRTTYESRGLAAMSIDVGGDRTSREILIRIHGSAPESTKADSMACALRVVDAAGATQRVETTIPLGTYEAKTTLAFPFRGRGVISQGGAADGGHANRGGQFAVDAIGLTPMYAPQIGEGDANEAASGFGRAILAPGAGVVVVARGDRPDQPVTGTSDPKFYVPEFPQGGDPGNHVVIDHENGELSMVAHMKKDSVAVRVGQRVKLGDAIGLLGNSGDSTFPHVHYQLMDGPRWTSANALPFRFPGLPPRLVRGTWFEAKG